MRSTRYLNFHATQAVSQMSLVVFSLFLPLFLDRRGYDAASVGTILAVGPVVSLATQSFWGLTGDRARSKNRVIIVMYLGAAVCSLLFYPARNLALALLVMAGFSFFYVGIEPMTTALTLEYVETRGWKFGPIRVSGTLGFAAMAVIAGVALRRNLDAAFFLLCGLCLLGAVVVRTLPEIRGHQRRQALVSPLRLLRHGELARLLALGGLLASTLMYYYSFFPVYYRQMGAGPVLLGWSTFLSALPEVAVLPFADRIYGRLGVRGMLFVAGAALCLRWLLFYFIRNPYAILPVQLLHPFTFIFIFFALASYINRTVEPGLKASGQALYGAVIGGLARIAGTLGGGHLSAFVGHRRMFLGAAAFTAACLLLFGALFAWQPARGRRPTTGSP